MKKKILLFSSALMLTGVLFTTGCKKAVENVASVECFSCTHPDPTTYPDIPDVCNALGVTTSTDVYTSQGYTCTKK